VSGRVRLDPRAAAELDQAAGWYEQQRSELVLEVRRAAVRALAQSPRAGSPVEGVDPALEVRRLRVRRFPYQVVYVILDEDVVVLTVAHDRRRPGYWAPPSRVVVGPGRDCRAGGVHDRQQLERLGAGGLGGLTLRMNRRLPVPSERISMKPGSMRSIASLSQSSISTMRQRPSTFTSSVSLDRAAYRRVHAAQAW